MALGKLSKILCVDDEDDILQVAKLSLETIGGFDVSLCSSGKEALKRVMEVMPDLILLDVMMPDMDGIATLGELLKKPASSAIPIIFMTARVQPKEIEEYIVLGACGVISKPFDPLTLPVEAEAFWKKFHGNQ